MVRLPSCPLAFHGDDLPWTGLLQPQTRQRQLPQGRQIRGSAFWSRRGLARFTALLTEMGVEPVVAVEKEHNGRVDVVNASLHRELLDKYRLYDLAEMQRRLAAHLRFHTREPRALARALATLVALTFIRAINRAPRRHRGGNSRVDLYGETVTSEARDAARAALRDRVRKQARARQTRHARLAPEGCALLDDASARLYRPALASGQAGVGLLHDPELVGRAEGPTDPLRHRLELATLRANVSALALRSRFLVGVVRWIRHGVGAILRRSAH